MIRHAFVVLIVAIVVTLGASMTVIVMTQQSKADRAVAAETKAREELIRSHASLDYAQTQLGLTRDALSHYTSELDAKQAYIRRYEETVNMCQLVGALTSKLMHAVARQTHAVTNTLRGKRALARRQLLRTAHDLNRAERWLERKGVKINHVVTKCAEARNG